MAPLVRILLRQGISCREFADVLKEVFVTEAARELATPERKASLARVAIVTGLTRKEVSSIVHDEELRRRARETNVEQTARVLEAWHTEARYLGPYGFPRDLVIEGDDPAGTFEQLVREFGSKVNFRTMLDDLLRIGAARLLEGGSVVRVLERSYIPKDMTIETIQIFTQAVRRYMQTVDFNLSRRDDVASRRFERLVYPDPGLLERDIPAFQQEMREYLESVIAEIDFRSSSYPRPDAEEGEVPVRVGVGLYFYREDPELRPDLTELIGGVSIEPTSSD
jgi:hypothetical protein